MREEIGLLGCFFDHTQKRGCLLVSNELAALLGVLLFAIFVPGRYSINYFGPTFLGLFWFFAPLLCCANWFLMFILLVVNAAYSISYDVSNRWTRGVRQDVVLIWKWYLIAALVMAGASFAPMFLDRLYARMQEDAVFDVCEQMFADENYRLQMEGNDHPVGFVRHVQIWVDETGDAIWFTLKDVDSLVDPGGEHGIVCVREGMSFEEAASVGDWYDSVEHVRGNLYRWRYWVDP